MHKLPLILLMLVLMLPALAQKANTENYVSKLQSTEQVTFIDSVVVPLDELFDNMKISQENGQVYSYAKYFNVADTTLASVFSNQVGNRIIYPRVSKAKLVESYKLGNAWSEATALEGLPQYKAIGYPFMLTDGCTLYFAAMGDESVGGWDIFMTRYDDDAHKFLTPENIGMPFNSEANDYLYVVDEYNHLGFFATDRRQPKGKVCIYCFIPNDSRRIYDFAGLGQEKVESYAKILSIRNTWTDNDAVEEAQKRLADMRKSFTRKAGEENFYLVINDRLTYTKLSQFKNSTAKSAAVKWLEDQKKLDSLSKELSDLRDEYHRSGSEKLGCEILKLEQEYEDLYGSVQSQIRQIRQLEAH